MEFKVNGNSIMRIVNKTPRLMENVKLYFGKGQTATGDISNLLYESWLEDDYDKDDYGKINLHIE